MEGFSQFGNPCECHDPCFNGAVEQKLGLFLGCIGDEILAIHVGFIVSSYKYFRIPSLTNPEFHGSIIIISQKILAKALSSFGFLDLLLLHFFSKIIFVNNGINYQPQLVSSPEL